MKEALKILLLIFLWKITSTSLSKSVHKKSLVLNSSRNYRLPRCNSGRLGYLARTFAFDESEKGNEYLRYINVSAWNEDGQFGESNMKNLVLSGLIVNENVGEVHWNDFKSVYKKRYCSKKHEMSALAKWKRNLERVAEHNRQFLFGLQSYTLHLNHFGDLATKDYFKKILKLIETPFLFDPALDHHKTAYLKNLHHKVPREVDWRKKGFKPRREEQWQCGACYAFAVAHALQAQLYKTHKEWKELSTQQIVDCSAVDGNSGCDGGSLRAAFRYVAREGLTMEQNYPYKGKQGHCHYNSLQVRAKPRRWAMLPTGDERAMEKALATIGPLAVAVNAEPFTFQLYKSGIYDDPFCTPWSLNHAMLLVGYTPEYWILLNWWGPKWGEEGYMRIRRGFNRCGVANMAAYVEL